MIELSPSNKGHPKVGVELPIKMNAMQSATLKIIKMLASIGADSIVDSMLYRVLDDRSIAILYTNISQTSEDDAAIRKVFNNRIKVPESYADREKVPLFIKWSELEGLSDEELENSLKALVLAGASLTFQKCGDHGETLTPYEIGRTALTMAVIESSIRPSDALKKVQLLIKAGADLHQRDEKGDTPLIIAAREGYTEIVQEILAAPQGCKILKNQGERALKIAQGKGYNAIVDLIKNHRREQKVAFLVCAKRENGVSQSFVGNSELFDKNLLRNVFSLLDG